MYHVNIIVWDDIGLGYYMGILGVSSFEAEMGTRTVQPLREIQPTRSQVRYSDINLEP